MRSKRLLSKLLALTLTLTLILNYLPAHAFTETDSPAAYTEETSHLNHLGSLSGVITGAIIALADPCIHSFWWTVSKPATCLTAGEEKAVCSNTDCDETDTREIPATGHSFTNYVTTTPAACTVTGVSTAACNNTGCSATDTRIIPMRGHLFDNNPTIIIPATCTTDGLESRQCLRSECNVTVGDITIPATGHSFTVYTLVTQSTCTLTGEETAPCDNIGCSETDTRDIAALGHDFSAPPTIDVPATCTTDGVQSHKCQRVDCLEKDTPEIIPATGHSFTDYVTTTPAACTVTGIATAACDNIGCSETDTNIIPVLGHDFDNNSTVIIPATCTTDGLESRRCLRSDCTETIGDITIPATGHSFIIYTPVTQPTCTLAGEETAPCDNTGCNETNARDIAALGHDFSAPPTIDVPATCTTDGEKSHKCQRIDCLEKDTPETIPATGHDFTIEIERVPPTLHVDGFVTHQCAYCTEIEHTVLPKTGVPAEITSINNKTIDSGTTDTFQVTATGNPNTFTYSLSSQPSGVTINDSTGLITIADTTLEGIHSFTIIVSNGIIPDAQQVFTLTVVLAPIYGISLDPSGNLIIKQAIVGYSDQPARSVSVINTGNQQTGLLNISLSGDNATSFILNKASIANIDVGARDSFTITPVSGLGVKTHTAVITITGSNVAAQSFTASFTVTEIPTVTFEQSYTGSPLSTTVTTDAEGKIAAADWPTNPTRTGYTFSGWYLGLSGSVLITSSYVFDKDTILHARWQAIDTGPTGGGGGGGPGGGPTTQPPPTQTPPQTKPKEEIPQTPPQTTTYRLDNTALSPSTGTSINNGQVPLAPGDPRHPSNMSFEDVDSIDWFFNAVDYVAKNSLMTGTSTDPLLFSPNMTLTRGMVVTVLYRKVGAPDTDSLANPFRDVAPGEWYADAVKWAVANDIVKGFGNGLFGPNDNISRQDLAVMMDNYAKYIEAELIPVRSYPGFNDDARIAVYAKEAIERFYMAGIINGKPGNLFDPQGNATRAEFATMLRNFLAVI